MTRRSTKRFTATSTWAASGIFRSLSQTRSNRTCNSTKLHASVSACMLSSVIKSVARKQSRPQGGAAIVGSSRFPGSLVSSGVNRLDDAPEPARRHSARLQTPGFAVIEAVRSSEIQVASKESSAAATVETAGFYQNWPSNRASCRCGRDKYIAPITPEMFRISRLETLNQLGPLESDGEVYIDAIGASQATEQI